MTTILTTIPERPMAKGSNNGPAVPAVFLPPLGAGAAASLAKAGYAVRVIAAKAGERTAESHACRKSGGADVTQASSVVSPKPPSGSF